MYMLKATFIPKEMSKNMNSKYKAVTLRLSFTTVSMPLCVYPLNIFAKYMYVCLFTPFSENHSAMPMVERQTKEYVML